MTQAEKSPECNGLIRVPPETVRVRTEHPPEEPEWSPAAYRAAKAVEEFYRAGDS